MHELSRYLGAAAFAVSAACGGGDGPSATPSPGPTPSPAPGPGAFFPLAAVWSADVSQVQILTSVNSHVQPLHSKPSAQSNVE